MWLPSHHRLEPQDLVEDRVALRLLGREVGGAQLRLLQQVPGRHGDELPGRDHPRRSAGDALDQDLLVRVVLGNEVGDDVVARLDAERRTAYDDGEGRVERSDHSSDQPRAPRL